MIRKLFKWCLKRNFLLKSLLEIHLSSESFLNVINLFYDDNANVGKKSFYLIQIPMVLNNSSFL